MKGVVQQQGKYKHPALSAPLWSAAASREQVPNIQKIDRVTFAHLGSWKLHADSFMFLEGVPDT